MLNVKITPKSPRRGPKTPPRVSWKRERAPKKLGGSVWEVKIAPKSPRRAPKRPPRAPRAPGRPPRGGKRGPREHPNALATTEDVPRTAEAIIILKTKDYEGS